MKIAVLYDEVTPLGGGDQLDVLEEIEAVSLALTNLGHQPVPLAFHPDLARTAAALGRIEPGLVFNLVESVAGRGKFIHLAPLALDALGRPYTGSPTDAVYLTSNKLLAKRRLIAAGVATPDYVALGRESSNRALPADCYIIKPICEDASVGLDDDSIVSPRDLRDLRAQIERRSRLIDRECFAEAYVDGREFGVSLLSLSGEPRVLPPAEILFVDYPEGKTRVVDYRAKWVPDSFEYGHTPRTFDFEEKDAGLLRRLRSIALVCWRLFGLGGYARVDFRVDSPGKPWVLEINVNPCLSPDCGFVAAAGRAGLDFDAVIDTIVKNAAPVPGRHA